MVDYLSGDMDVRTLKAYVMPENVYSQKVLLKNGFLKESETFKGHNWSGIETVSLNVYSYNNDVLLFR